METTTATTTTAEPTVEPSGGGGLFNQFRDLPGGVQRLIIAVLVVSLVFAAYFVARLMQTEEATDQPAGEL